jgi:hypothetical protein
VLSGKAVDGLEAVGWEMRVDTKRLGTSPKAGRRCRPGSLGDRTRAKKIKTDEDELETASMTSNNITIQ